MKKHLICLLCIMPLMLAAQQVQKVAILETVDKEGNISYACKLMLRSNLSKAITNAPGYEAYDRTDMDAIMGEQNFQRTGMVSDDQIKRLGEMTGAQYILVAEAVKVDEQNMFITAKILNVETAKTEVTDNALMGVSASDIQHGCESLANKLLGISAAVVEPSQAQKQAKNAQEQMAQQSESTPNPVRGTLGAPKVTQSSSTSLMQGIGDLYTFPDGSKGVLFYKTSDGHGLVVSLDVYTARWENVNSNFKCHDIIGLPNEDGSKFMTFRLGESNTAYIIQELGEFQAPAALWCKQHGDGWYLPSSGELWYLFMINSGRMSPSGQLQASKQKDIITNAMKRVGGQILSDDWYWSSTENDKDEAINVSLSGRVSSEDKKEALLVRAVRAF